MKREEIVIAFSRRGGKNYFDYRIGGRRALTEFALKFDYPERLFEEFLTFSRTNHSLSTQRRYKTILNHLKSFLAKYPYPTRTPHLTTEFFEDYKSFRKDEGVADKTINIELRMFSAMFCLAKNRGYVTDRKYGLNNLIEPHIIRKSKFLSSVLMIVFLTGLLLSLFCGLFAQNLADTYPEQPNAAFITARQMTKNRITMEQFNLLSNTKTIDIRQAWEEIFGVDVWYPYFTAKEVETRIKKKLGVKILKLKGEPQIEKGLLAYAFKATF